MGSIISLIGVIIFCFVVYSALTDGVTVGAQNWKEAEFFDHSGAINWSTTLEWVQSSPPVGHTYNELPYLVAHNDTKH